MPNPSMEPKRIPLLGIAIAVVAGIVMLASGVDAVLAVSVVMLWVVSLWLAIPPAPPPQRQEIDGVQLTQSGIRDLIENSGMPLLMLDSERIIIANAAAREAIGAHVVGQDPRVALRHPEAVKLLASKRTGSVVIRGLTGARSTWEMRQQVIDSRYSLIELINRTSEADIGRAHTDFVANASHELRTPLSSIIGYVETLVDDPDMAPKQRQHFYDIVLQEAHRMQALVSDLMSLSRIEAEKHDHPRTPADLAAAVNTAARDAAGARRMGRVEIGIAKGKFMVQGDARQLDQLVRNLVDNALKYGREDGVVTVDLVKGDRGMAILSVRDRGDGIPPEHIPHLTRRFYRTDPGRSRAAGGTGLGLAIVKHIVERHRGRLDIASRPGEGTVVTVRIPLQPKPDKPPRGDEKADSSSMSQN